MKNILLLATLIIATLSSFLAQAQTVTHATFPVSSLGLIGTPGATNTTFNNIGKAAMLKFDINKGASSACYGWGFPTINFGGMAFGTISTATPTNGWIYQAGSSILSQGLVVFTHNPININAYNGGSLINNFTLSSITLRIDFCVDGSANRDDTPLPVTLSNDIIAIPLDQNSDVYMQITASSIAGDYYLSGGTGARSNVPILDLYDVIKTQDGFTLNTSIVPGPWYSRYSLPSVTVTPTSPTTMCTGGNLTSNPSGGSGSYTYSWPTGYGLNNTTIQNPILNSAIPSQTFTVTITDTYNCKAAASTAAVTVVNDPTISTQPTPLSGDVCVGAIITPLTVAATGGTGTISYQWYSDANGDYSGSLNLGNFNGANTTSFTPPTSSTGTTYYFCVVSQTGAGCGPLYTNIITVNVVADPTVTNPTPATQTVCQNAPSTNLTVTTSGGTGALTYQWFYNQTGLTSGGTAVGGNSNTVTPLTSLAAGTYYYYCVVTRSGAGCNTATSSTATVIVNALPSISNQALNVCSGVQFSNTPSLSATYSWSAPSGSGFSGGAPGSGAASITGTLTTTSGGTATYTVTPTSNLGCPGTPFTLTVTVNPLPVPSIAISNENSGIANDGLLCANTPITLTASATGAGGGYTYNWTTPGGPNGSNPIVITNATNANHGSYTVTVTAANTCSASATQSVTVYPLPSGGSIDPQSFCPGGSVLSTVNDVTNVTTYSWSLPTQLSGSSTNNNISLTGTVSGVYTVTVTPINATTANSCPGPIVTGTVTIKPVPTVTTVNNNPTICSGQNANITLSPLPANVGGTLFDWSRNNTINVTGDFSENNVSGPIIETLTNTTFVPQTVVFTITPKADGCPGTPVQVSVVVNPTPDMTVTNNDTHICTGESTNITLTSSVSGTTFNWTRTNGNVSGLTFQNGNTGTIAIPLTNATGINHASVFTITPVANGCFGSDQNTIVNVGALPNITLPVSAGASTVCEGSGTTVTINPSQTDVTYQLRRSDNSPVVGAVVSGPGTGPKVINVPASALTVLGSPHTFNIWATTAAPYSCSAQLTNTVTITVHGNSTPPTSATVNGQPTITICPNAVANINLAAFGGFVGAGALVRWYSGGCASGPVIATGATVSIPPPAVTTTYFVNYSGSVCAPTTCASVTVVVSDTTLPTITCPAPISVNTTPGVCSAVVVYSVTTSDNCSVASVDQLQGIGSAGTFPLGVTLNQFRVTDGSGNTATCSFTVTVTDNQAPVVQGSNGSSTVPCPANATLPSAPIALDNCNGTISGVLFSTVNSPSSFTCEGIRVYTFSYTDGASNVSYWTYTYTIERLPFTISTPNGTADVACPYETDTPPTLPTVTDHCGNVLTPSAPVISPIPVCEGDRTYTYTYTDCEGNSQNWVFTYTVIYDSFFGPSDDSMTVACPDDTDNNPPFPDVFDNCGNPLTPVLQNATAKPVCEGERTLTYLYSDCVGNEAEWNFTYYVVYEDFTPPAPGGSTVSCPNQTDTPPTLPTFTDNCGETLTPSAPVVSVKPACEGTRTYTYTLTDCAGFSHNWVYTYTIDYTGGLTPPANTISTVSCPGAAVNPGAPANITDACGRTVSPVLIGSVQVPNPVTCEGTIVWTYRYTACDGTTTADWTHTYTIDYSGGLTPPANTTSTVSCPANAVNPGAPANITDACGRTVSATLIGAIHTPDPVTCEGTIVWTYRYTACDGTTTADWTHTYTIDYSGGLTPPANTTSTVSCPANAVNPGAPANITDACGRTVSATLIGATHTPNPVTCEGTIVWTYRYTACDGTTTADWTHTYTIDYSGGLTPPANTTSTVSCPANAVNPGAPANITDACGRTVSATLIGATHTPNPVTCEGTIVWTYRYTACDGTTTADWTHTYTIDYSGGLTPPANTTSTVSCPANATNPGAPANITDACGRMVSATLIGATQTPDPVTCEGTIVWTYRYTACDGTTTADWTHTYTIDYSGGLTPPANTTSTVSCPANAVNPGAPANITDACGRTVSATLIGATQTPDPVTCEGTIVWTYRYTACDGTTTADWTHTYTIDYSGGLTPPANTTSTVSCPANATNPGAPANITDACGRTVSATLIGATQTPDPVTCEGTIVWTYRYTACDGTTTADWTHTYTIDYSGGLTPPVNTTSTVSCPANATNPGAPANITDACGRTVSATLIDAIQTPDPVTCEGTIVWTYRYTACDGTTTADWTHTYTIDYSGGLTPPTSTTSTVSCPANATNPGAPANITDACGRTVSAALIGAIQTPDPVSCEGTIVWTYRYTACDGTTTADWTHTYTIERLDFSVPTNGSLTVDCGSDAVPPTLPTVTDNCGTALTPTGPAMSGTYAGCGGTIIYTYTYTDCELNTHDWLFTYTVVPQDFTVPPNGSKTVACEADAVTPPLPDVDSDCGIALTPAGPVMSGDYDGCEGTIIYTYTYTDCAGYNHDWSYIYTVVAQDFTMPANSMTTVSCPDATDTAPALPVVTDFCGNLLTPTGPPVISAKPACEGTRTYTYTYVDCDNNSHNWVFTYNVEREDFTMPANDGTTVACITMAIAPAAPAVTDNCGTPLNPTGPAMGGTYDGCEGTRTYTFTYTDCELNTHDWVYTYTIEREDFTVPGGGSSTVACIALATAPALRLR
ncbi:MAG: HYR domain-containing protein [Sphingobacteriales bacterium]|nr:MAG: HYR domain-containing protein [Sphingobacteriales bacterium]